MTPNTKYFINNCSTCLHQSSVFNITLKSMMKSQRVLITSSKIKSIVVKHLCKKYCNHGEEFQSLSEEKI